jgi:hypothetical protein
MDPDRETSLNTSTLKTEAAWSSENLVTIYKTTWRHNLEDNNPHFHRRENLKFHPQSVFFIQNETQWVQYSGLPEQQLAATYR